MYESWIIKALTSKLRSLYSFWRIIQLSVCLKKKKKEKKGKHSFLRFFFPIDFSTWDKM